MSSPPPPDGDLTAGCAWIDGGLVPVHEARIPILDTGFLRSDLTYDVVAVWRGSFFRLDDHLDRLERGCVKLRLHSPVDREGTRRILFELVRSSGLRDAYVAAIVTRGTAPAGSRDPRTFQNRFYAFAVPYVWVVSPERHPRGAELVVSRSTHRIPASSVDPTVKNFHWGDLIRGAYEAYDRGGTTVVLPDAEGNVTEGPGVNLFCVSGGVVRTPSRGVLEGVTRRTVLELATELGIEARVEDVAVSALYDADEIFLTSTAGGVMPAATLDSLPIGEKQPGAVTETLRRAYWDAHADARWSEPVDYRVAGG